MRIIPNDLAAELASGVTTLCRCWRVMRRDQVTFGFTDHDRDLAFSGVTYLAQSGLDSSEAVSSLGFAVGSSEIMGALVAEAIQEDDILSGVWDHSLVEVWLVDWRDTTRRMLFDSGQIGEITRTGKGFTAEVRSLAHQFDQDKGRRYEALCSAAFGDLKCGIELSNPSHAAIATIANTPDDSTFAVALLAQFSSGAFTHGRVILSPGLPDELSLPIQSHTRLNGYEVISLWSPSARPLVQGASVQLQMGCDKHFSTCRDRFSNAANFRGFPHIPGNDFLFSYARQGDAELDGGVVVP